MKYTFNILFLISTICFNSCNSDEQLSEEERISRERKQRVMNLFQTNFSSVCQLLSYKHSVDTNIIQNIVTAYSKNYNYSEYCLRTEGKVSAINREKVKRSQKNPELSMGKLIHDISVKNSLSDSITALILFDYIAIGDPERFKQ
jgi:hypothetical protein